MTARVFGGSVVRPSGFRSLLAAESLELRGCAVAQLKRGAQSKRGAQGVQGFKGFRVNSKFRLTLKLGNPAVIIPGN